MKFEDALEGMRKGETWRRSTCKGTTFSRKGFVIQANSDGCEWTVGCFSGSTLLMEDWEKVDEYPLTFLEAMQALADGKKVISKTISTEGSCYAMVNGKVQLCSGPYCVSTGINLCEIEGPWRVVE